jgi:hypothetical protein
MPTYRYKPLNASTGEFRLVKLHPGPFDAPIKISIDTAPLLVPESEPRDGTRLDRARESMPPRWEAFETIDGRILFFDKDTQLTTWDHPDPHIDQHTYEVGSPTFRVSQLKYEALSYTWGSADDQVTIQVKSPSRPGIRKKKSSLIIRRILHEALKHLRDEANPRILWIDAISINQDDLDERSHQVTRMGDIYRHAHRVVVWLGTESPKSTLTMRTLAYIGDQIEFTKDASITSAPNCTETDWYSIIDASRIASDPRTWRAIHNLLRRPWFDRLWIKQEIQLANTSALVQCGTDTITWHQLRRAIILCNHMRFLEPSLAHLPLVLAHRTNLATGSTGYHPVHLLRDAVYAKCGDPRDKVYALLGLLPPALAQRIQPRYDWPIPDVYREAFRAYVECTGSLDILNLVGPSWKPDWSVDKKTLGFGGCYSCSDSTAGVSHNHPDELLVTGMLHDTVKEVTSSLPFADNRILETVWNIWLKDANPNQLYSTGESLAQACAWTLKLGELHERWSYCNFASVLDAQRPFERLEQDRVLYTDPNIHLQKSVVTEDSILFKTTKGYFGMSFVDIMPGDKVCVLLGCSYTVILREQPSGKHLFVACAYVHGLMDGEALLGPLPPGYTVAVERDRNGDNVQTFVDSTTKTETTHDPRLEPLPAAWEPVVVTDRLWPTKLVDAFRHKETEQVLYSDPRLLPDALRARGVPIKTFTLQ